ncbi:integumentary mucin C.1-like [Pollicipes pollicipes]|uniref:integumentary mucin C.1-like n=1 Tax=Pollicipes pollicipes TaxID=41117 RepID=UPI001885997B|nr:integumentary mucin C.1-like [Pollicipes pollicipes]
MRPVLLIMLGCSLVSGGPAGEADFVSQPQDAHVQPGESVQLDCELVEADADDICAWRLAGTHLGVDHFYNVFPPPKVRALFPEHERVCTLIIEDVDWRHDGLWTCWPLDEQAHVSSRSARLTVAGSTSTPQPAPTDTPATTTPDASTTPTWPTTEPTTSAAPTTTPPATTTAAPSTTPPATTTTMPSTTATATTTAAPSTSAPTTPWTTPSPGPGFSCPQPDGLFADPENARFFYYCKDGEAVHMQCEFPQRWSDSQKNCA